MLNLWVSFRKIATNYRTLWREMSNKNTASYGFSPPCMGWLRLVGSLKIIGLFCKRALLKKNILQKRHIILIVIKPHLDSWNATSGEICVYVHVYVCVMCLYECLCIRTTYMCARVLIHDINWALVALVYMYIHRCTYSCWYKHESTWINISMYVYIH